jgi:ribosome-binding protein aMBF1 (putative translation factor)
MLKELRFVTDLPAEAKPIVLALSIILDRIRSLPRADREDLFELFQALQEASGAEETAEIVRAMEEILAQVPVRTQAMPLDDDQPMPGGLAKLVKYVGGEIQKHRKAAGLKQSDLAKKTGLTQSHISRLENGEHSATHLTLEKIAKALGIEVRQLDPSAD